MARKDVDHEKNQNTEIRKVANLFDLPMHIETAKVSELASNVVPEESVIKNEMVENVVEPQHLDSLSSLSESVKSCKDEEEADMNKSTLKKNETSPVCVDLHNFTESYILLSLYKYFMVLAIRKLRYKIA